MRHGRGQCPETGAAPVGETSLTGGDLDRIKTGKLTLSGYLRAGYAAGAGRVKRRLRRRIGYHARP
jgi:hypothetical protein